MIHGNEGFAGRMAGGQEGGKTDRNVLMQKVNAAMMKMSDEELAQMVEAMEREMGSA